ncbi:MAG: carbamoyl-phosphate synthase small subunit [Planctomycetota bacterium]|nr:MAG: carbamoyl-phosphate synthase small subunit [Planctomycetota bacterium]
MTQHTLARLVLSDGTIFRGRAVGAIGTVEGEAVFNTGMTGYQEVLSDPSYRGQIVTMTYPEIGNYGIIPEDMESDHCQLAGFVMRSCCHHPSNFRSTISLPDFLAEQGIIGIEGVDTRKITKRLREAGALPAVLSSDASLSDDDLIQRAAAASDMSGKDLASDAGTSSTFTWEESCNVEQFGHQVDWQPCAAHIVAIDLGMKHNILRLLKSCGFRISVVPGTASADEILALQPQGIFVSNGPGDPAVLDGPVATIRALIDHGLPMFGICLGHQLIARALGASTFKLKFGHRGCNHPIKNLASGSIEIASHNHGFAVDADSLPEGVVMTHRNLNDNTCAGLRHTSKSVFSVQYHPEACPGPSDPVYLFKQFRDLVAESCPA